VLDKKYGQGVLGGTLFEYDAVSDRWKKIETDGCIERRGIQSIAATKEKVFICRDNGVSIYDLPTGRWESLTAADGLLSNSVFCAAEDKNCVWFGTDKGVSRLMLTTLNDIADCRTRIAELNEG